MPTLPVRNPASYRLERDIQDHMTKRVLIGADSSPIRNSGPLAKHYEEIYRNRRGRPTEADRWETMDYDAWITRFRNMIAHKPVPSRIIRFR